MVNKELIDKFFNNRCNADEAKAVVAYFRKYPDELERHLPEKEWAQFYAHASLGEEVPERMLKNIRKETYKTPVRRIKFTVISSIAASLLLGLFVLGRIYTGHHKSEPITAKVKTLNKPKDPELIKKENNGSQPFIVKLGDGSQISLLPGSEIQYQNNIRTAELRNITLKGGAMFKVAKDTARPFTVIAGGLSTTALGTSFTVRAYSGNKKINVKLHTGRVVIRAVSEKLKNTMADVYLSPGQQFELDPVSLATSIINPASARADPKEKTGTVHINGDVVEFDKLALSDVFDKLAEIYATPILYQQPEFSNTYFTGKINKTDPLEDVLNTIAILNGLKINKDGETYNIKK